MAAVTKISQPLLLAASAHPNAASRANAISFLAEALRFDAGVPTLDDSYSFDVLMTWLYCQVVSQFFGDAVCIWFA